MTYERPEILLDTISKVFAQTLPPEKLLIVDNSETNRTELLMSKLDDSRAEYFRVGYNAGPAGAAKIGLQKLADAGYDWIYWGDDDDPPTFEDSFEKLFAMIDSNAHSEIGIVGGVGQYFNRSTGVIERVSNNELMESKTLRVDSIAGGQTMVVNARVVREGILPNEKLFFGFEELDFCLRVKKAGFNLLVPCDLFIRSRVKYNRINLEKSIYIKQEISKLPRQYYSTRNMLHILRQQRWMKAYYYQLAKSVIKSIYGFRFGLKYGFYNSQMILLAIYDYMNNKLGKRF